MDDIIEEFRKLTDRCKKDKKQIRLTYAEARAIIKNIDLLIEMNNEMRAYLKEDFTKDEQKTKKTD